MDKKKQKYIMWQDVIELHVVIIVFFYSPKESAWALFPQVP